MAKTIIKELYILLVSFFSLIFKGKKIKKQVAYLMSFPKNDNGFIQSFKMENPTVHFIVFYTKNVEEEAKRLELHGIQVIPLNNTINSIKKTVSTLMISKVIICDNYFPILGGLFPKNETNIIQLWHANGAIKKFGLEDKFAQKQNRFDKKRYTKVYKRFSNYIVGSEMMGKVFKHSYNALDYQIDYIGNPRTDIYFNPQKLKEQEEYFYRIYPELRQKKIILYAPTYRNNRNENYPLDIGSLYKAFKDEYVLLFRTHPHIHINKKKFCKDYERFCYTNLNQFSIENLLPVTDILITDYSSVPFDFTLLKKTKKIIFYCYDLEEYNSKQGIQENFSDWAPGAVVKTTEEIIENISTKDHGDYNKFNLSWNQYNDGQSTQRLIKYIQNKLTN